MKLYSVTLSINNDEYFVLWHYLRKIFLIPGKIKKMRILLSWNYYSFNNFEYSCFVLEFIKIQKNNAQSVTSISDILSKFYNCDLQFLHI